MLTMLFVIQKAGNDLNIILFYKSLPNESNWGIYK